MKILIPFQTRLIVTSIKSSLIQWSEAHTSRKPSSTHKVISLHFGYLIQHKNIIAGCSWTSQRCRFQRIMNYAKAIWPSKNLHWNNLIEPRIEGCRTHSTVCNRKPEMLSYSLQVGAMEVPPNCSSITVQNCFLQHEMQWRCQDSLAPSFGLRICRLALECTQGPWECQLTANETIITFRGAYRLADEKI